MAQGLKIMTSDLAVAQFAGSIGRDIITLRDLWIQVKCAPAEINDLVDRLNHLRIVLEHMGINEADGTAPKL